MPQHPQLAQPRTTATLLQPHVTVNVNVHFSVSDGSAKTSGIDGSVTENCAKPASHSAGGIDVQCHTSGPAEPPAKTGGIDGSVT